MKTPLIVYKKGKCLQNLDSQFTNMGYNLWVLECGYDEESNMTYFIIGGRSQEASYMEGYYEHSYI